jgi:hypothetical protein
MIVSSPTDLGDCLPATFPYESIPVEVQVAPDGTARPGLGFYDQCSGDTFTVDEATTRCLEAKLARWRWVVLNPCRERTMYGQSVVRAIRPAPTPPKRVQASTLPRWTGLGCGG